MKKMICLLLAAAFAGMLSGCGQGAKSGFRADNEIVTYRRVDPEKTQIVVSRTGNVEVAPFCEAFEKRNPDVQVVYLDITGGNEGYKPLVEWITRGYAPDVVFSAANFFDDKLTPSYFENLSTDPVLQNYEAAALKRTAVNDDVYALPGPSNINAMMYNKTLFAQYGWEAPKTFDAFVTLCDRIRADTDGAVEPWNPNAKYSQELQIALEAFTYAELFGGAENRAWYNDFIAGKAAFAGHMEPYMEMMQTLADHGILREEHFSYSATTRGKEFAAGRIAMINVNIYDADNDEFDFGYMPFPTTRGELGYLSDSYSCYVSLPVKEHTDAESDAIRRFIDFFSSPEGQRIYIGKAMKVSNVKGVPIAGSDDLAALQPAIDAGHMFADMNFSGISGERSKVDLHQSAMDIVAGERTVETCIADADAAAAIPAEEAQTEPPEALAVVERDMTVLETSFYMADAYRTAARADVGLIAHNLPYRGNVMRLFAGDVTPGIVAVWKPRSFANDSRLVKLSMTGRQILDALNDPAGNEKIGDCVYAYSGLKCRVAPWNPLGERYLSVKLADGSSLAPDKLYTVAAWAGTVRDGYVTDTLETYEGTWEEIMTAQLRAAGTVKAADDGRIRLVWN